MVLRCQHGGGRGPDRGRHAPRAHADLDPPPSAQVSQRSEVIQETLNLPDRGGGGRQRGLGGHGTSLIVI